LVNFDFDILYFSTNGCINTSLTYLLTYLDFFEDGHRSKKNNNKMSRHIGSVPDPKMKWFEKLQAFYTYAVGQNSPKFFIISLRYVQRKTKCTLYLRRSINSAYLFTVNAQSELHKNAMKETILTPKQTEK